MKVSVYIQIDVLYYMINNYKQFINGDAIQLMQGTASGYRSKQIEIY